VAQGVGPEFKPQYHKEKVAINSWQWYWENGMWRSLDLLYILSNLTFQKIYLGAGDVV
jgi:hypothetical protein